MATIYVIIQILKLVHTGIILVYLNCFTSCMFTKHRIYSHIFIICITEKEKYISMEKVKILCHALFLRMGCMYHMATKKLQGGRLLFTTSSYVNVLHTNNFRMTN